SRDRASHEVLCLCTVCNRNLSFDLRDDLHRFQPPPRLHAGMPFLSRNFRVSSPFLTWAAMMAGFPPTVTREPVTVIVSLVSIFGVCLSMYELGPRCTAMVSLSVCNIR